MVQHKDVEGFHSKAQYSQRQITMTLGEYIAYMKAHSNAD